MKLRIYTSNTYLDIEVKDENINVDSLIEGLDECGIVALPTVEGSVMIINAANVSAIEIISTPPIK